MKSPADTIIESLQNHPEEWIHLSCKLIHRPTNTFLWVANGWTFLGFDSAGSTSAVIGFWDRWRIWRAFKKWQCVSVALKFEQARRKSDANRTA